MFGNILIDKFDGYINRDEKTNGYEHYIYTVLSKYLVENSFKIEPKPTSIGIHFNPTRFLSDYSSDVNIEMIEEKLFIDLLTELSTFNNENLSEKIVITSFDLTKNILTCNPVYQYTTYLLTTHKYNYGYIAQAIYEKGDNKTVSIFNGKNRKNMQNINKEVVFYSKADELINKGIKSIVLKNSLQESELNMLNMYYKSNYVKDGKILYLEGLNILRGEIQLQYSALNRLATHILNKKNNTKLTIAALLQTPNLYECLESYYISELKRIIFHIEPKHRDIDELNSKAKKLLVKLSLKTGIDLQNFVPLYIDSGLKDPYNDLTKEIVPYLTSEIYTEMYNDFGMDTEIYLKNPIEGIK